MKIINAEFAHCVGMKSQLPETPIPEIAFAGRSNVGKSSMINRLINRKALARTSGQPGKTQTLNFYLVNEQVYLVDLPGYGYAKVPHSIRNKWKQLLEDYLSRREALKGVALVVDSRHPPLESDVMMYEWLLHYDKPIFVVATKVDKLRQRDFKGFIQRLAAVYSQAKVIPFSSEKGTGREEIWRQISDIVSLDFGGGENA